VNRAHWPRKRFGQHFLHDPGTLRRLLKEVAPCPEDLVLEIGPGEGILTRPLVESGAEVHAIEVDRDLARMLREQFAGERRFILHEGDALAFDFDVIRQDRPLRVVGNLPYNISAPLMLRLLAMNRKIKDLHLMVQREMAERITASPGRRSYGRLSVMVQLYCREIRQLFLVPPGAFRPPPAVHSAALRLRPRVRQLPPEEIQQVAEVLQSAFSKRRKTLRRSLENLISREEMLKIGIDPNRRAEQLDLAAFRVIGAAILQRDAGTAC